MNKINIKLITVFAILAFVFGLSLATPAFAQTTNSNAPNPFRPTSYGTVGTALIFTPHVYPTENTTTNTNSNTTNTNSTNSNVTKKTTNNTSKTTTVSNTTDTNNTVATNNTNNNSVASNSTKDSYSSLTANALLGSNSFMPSGLLQWIFFVILILLIILAWRYVRRSEEKYMGSPMKHA